MYKALIKIGEYNVGDIVSTEEAELWLQMYKDAPVEKVSDRSSNEVSKNISEGKTVDTEDSNPMHDDYLNRNSDVVKAALRNDDLDKSVLDSLLKLELSNKKRKKVINAIKLKLKTL